MTQSADPVTELAELVHELTAPITHSQPRRIWKHPNRTGAIVAYHESRHPSLLNQLRRGVLMRSGTVKDAVQANITPYSAYEWNDDAHDRHRAIVQQVAQWWNVIDPTYSADNVDWINLDGNIRSLLNIASSLPHYQIRDLVKDAQRWRTWCRIVGAWEDPPARPNVPCPNCGATQAGERTGLRIRFESATGTGGISEDAVAQAAVCLSCNRTWDADDIGVLARHIQDEEARRMTDEVLNVEPELPSALDGAFHTVWAYGNWRQLTDFMTRDERDAAADSVERFSRFVGSRAAADPELRWWADTDPRSA